jgi:hypothetical protein
MSDSELAVVVAPQTFPTPILIERAGASTRKKFFEFFTVPIRNANTRAAYYRAIQQFLAWVERAGYQQLEDIEPITVAAYIEILQRQAVQKHLTYGPCCLLSSDVYFELKREIAEQFKLHPAEVLVVGSAKLGFSIVPKKRYRFFNDESDIDVALVAPQLFEQVWAEVYDYWYGGAYWDQHDTFCSYLFQGWIRPDKLPPFDRAAKWWEYFRELTSTSRCRSVLKS